jgi:methylenetetrahydrofolate dehydrogenase (NADP+) / methenyltetrahydrofolate cyclohydrolase
MLLDGHKIAKEIHNEIKNSLAAPFPRKPTLACVLTSQNPASLMYVGRKTKACQEVGIQSQVFHLEPQSTKELTDFIQKLNIDPAIDGILIQLPLPRKINLLEVIESIDPAKDVDGFHPLNVGRVLLQDPNAFYPCTPLGIKVLLEKHDVKVEGKHVVIVGRSNIVGKPLAALLLHDAPGCNATVTVAHSHTKNLQEITLSADILVVAIGKPHFIGADNVREGACVVDVGSSKISSSGAKSGFRVVGDVEYEAVRHKCSAITPVPGGVGPMTIAMLLKNTLKSFLHHVSHQ